MSGPRGACGRPVDLAGSSAPDHTLSRRTQSLDVAVHNLPAKGPLNLIVDSTRDRQELKRWFTEVWNDENLVKDVKQDVLLYLGKLYANQSPQFVYYLTLFHLFRDYLDGNRDIEDDLRRVALPDTRIWRTLFTFQKDGA